MNDTKTVLCYGDSNTYGYNPQTGLRYPKNIRWTGILKNLLGEGYDVIEEGCNGRTTVFDDPIEGWKNGIGYLKPCLNTHKPVNIVILMLGSNDLKNVFHASATDIAAGAEYLVDIIRAFTEEKQGFIPEIILCSPIHIGSNVVTGPFSANFDETAIERSHAFSTYYKCVAGRKDCIFFDASKHAGPSVHDGLHMDPESHQTLAEGLYQVIKSL